MTGTEPIESGVKAMPHRSDNRPFSGWARSISFVFIDTSRFCIEIGNGNRKLTDLMFDQISHPMAAGTVTFPLSTPATGFAKKSALQNAL